MDNSKEKIIREKRTIEATKKDLMGPSGKLGMIARYLGHPVIQQDSSLYDVNYLYDPSDEWTTTERATTVSGQEGPEIWRDEILEYEDQSITHLGHIFDGLSRGIQIEVTYFHNSHRLRCVYKGYEVYHEIAGELQCYAPFPEWERIIDRIHLLAKANIKDRKSQQDAETGKELEKKKKNLWQELKLRWGL